MHCFRMWVLKLTMKFWTAFHLCHSKNNFILQQTNSKVNLSTYNYSSHDKMMIWHYLSYLCQMLMNFTQKWWLILEPVFAILHWYSKTGFLQQKKRVLEAKIWQNYPCFRAVGKPGSMPQWMVVQSHESLEGEIESFEK